MDKILDKRQVNSIFKATVKIVKDIEVKTLENIEESINGLEYCYGENDYISYYLGEYKGTIDKKELSKNDSYFKPSNITKQLAYLDILVDEDDTSVIVIKTYVYITYNTVNGEESQSLVLHETII